MSSDNNYKATLDYEFIIQFFNKRKSNFHHVHMYIQRVLTESFFDLDPASTSKILKDQRKQKDLSLETVSEQIGFQLASLKLVEEGSWDQLFGGHITGKRLALRYADFLGVALDSLFPRLRMYQLMLYGIFVVSLCILPSTLFSGGLDVLPIFSTPTATPTGTPTLTLTPSPTATSLPTATPTVVVTARVISGGNKNVRSEPSRNSSRVGWVAGNTVVQVLDKANATDSVGGVWYKITPCQFNSGQGQTPCTGWIFGELLRFE